jgi:hypothetical protein
LAGRIRAYSAALQLNNYRRTLAIFPVDVDWPCRSLALAYQWTEPRFDEVGLSKNPLAQVLFSAFEG